MGNRVIERQRLNDNIKEISGWTVYESRKKSLRPIWLEKAGAKGWTVQTWEIR